MMRPFNRSQNGSDRLKSLVAGSPDQRRRVDELGRLIDLKREDLEQSIALLRAGDGNAAVVLVRNGRGSRLMTQVGQVSSTVEKWEKGLVFRNGRVARRALERTVLAVVIATFLATVLLILALNLRRRELAERERRAQAIRQSEAATRHHLLEHRRRRDLDRRDGLHSAHEPGRRGSDRIRPE